MNFELLQTPKIIFGLEKFNNIGTLIKELGSRALIVANASALQKNLNTREIIQNSSSIDGFEFEYYIIKGEPSIEIIDAGVNKAKEFETDVIIGLGGGSAIDAGKAIGCLFTNDGSAKDYLEVIGKGSIITQPSLPTIAIPTTAGTGSEVTKNAVILAKKEKFKASIRSPFLIPQITIIDPTLMIYLSPSVTATCGMDALTQLIEAYTSNNSNQITDSLAILGIEKASKFLLTAYDEGNSLDARTNMALASLLSGICLANAGLGAVHGFASPMGGLEIPHGVICAALLAPTVEANIQALKRVNRKHPVLVKYAKLGSIVSDRSYSSEEEAHKTLVRYLKNLTRNLNIPRFTKFGISISDIKNIVEKAKKASSMKYNPVVLSDESLTEIVRQAI
ncbi:MAG: iron-containing alcohol dehydrogenase [Candidatus Hodarchaeales archaeon]